MIPRLALLWAGALVVLVGPAPTEVRAWNSVGHLAVAKLACDLLEDGHKSKLFALLKTHPHFESFLAAGRPEGVNEGGLGANACGRLA